MIEVAGTMDQYLDTLAREALALVEPFDVVTVYTDFRFLISRPDLAKRRNDFMAGLVDRLAASGKTFCTPSYSYTAEGNFLVQSTPTNTSALSSWLVSSGKAERSEHPLFSYVGFGPKADLLRSVGKSAFGEASHYDRLRWVNSGFLHLGRPVELGNTMVHHVEHCCGATYRIHKSFKTRVFRDNAFVGTDYTAFVRRRDVKNETFAFRFDLAAAEILGASWTSCIRAEVALPYLAAYPLREARALMVDLFTQSPTAFVSSDFQQY